MAPVRLAELVAALEAAAECVTPDEAAELWRNLAEVARALKQAGYPRPRRVRPAPAVAPGQGDLLDLIGPRGD
ncbi:hypothetical protein WK99_13810 [Burkholderia ubonensis]|nr:hypothetical protein WK99_13810 [Burkholderia ubonensis]